MYLVQYGERRNFTRKRKGNVNLILGKKEDQEDAGQGTKDSGTDRTGDKMRLLRFKDRQETYKV